MTKEPIDVERSPDFATVVADGAYAHFLEGFVSLLFYLDKVFPKHAQDGTLRSSREEKRNHV